MRNEAGLQYGNEGVDSVPGLPGTKARVGGPSNEARVGRSQNLATSLTFQTYILDSKRGIS